MTEKRDILFTKIKIQPLIRHVVQLLFAMAVIYIGISFIVFVKQIAADNSPTLNRPAGVEAFLPISALIGLKAWIATGTFDRIHPAGLIILLLALIVSVLFKRSFCSWVCPFGTLSEGLSLLSKALFKRDFLIPKYLDYILRSLKYLIFFFFFSIIFGGMSGAEATSFLQSPYNMIADDKMLRFIQNLNILGVTCIGFLLVLSIFFKNFWCRYLCPYGAFLGLLSILSPLKITRIQTSCIQCKKCTNNCPNHILVDQADRVWSPECTGCLNCIQQCPVKGTLAFKGPEGTPAFSPWSVALGILTLWTLIIIIAQSTGHWESSMSMEVYKKLLNMVDQI